MPWYPLVIEQLEKKGLQADNPNLPGLIELYQERAKTLEEMADSLTWVFKSELEFDEKAAAKFLIESLRPLFEQIITHLETCEPFSHDEIEKRVNSLMEETGLKMGKIAQPIRVALTGGTVSPSVFELLPLIGKDETLRRLKNALSLLEPE